MTRGRGRSVIEDLNADYVEVRISPNRVLYIEGRGVRLGSSSVVGAVEVREDGLYVGGRQLVFRQALRCPVRVGGNYLCGGPAERPRFFYREVFVEGLNKELRLAELYATSRLNAGDCLAEYLYWLVKGASFLWDIYHRRQPAPPRRCEWFWKLATARGLRERTPYLPPRAEGVLGAMLGLLKFGDALQYIERSWRGFVVALRYGIYSALTWRLPPGEESWYLLLGIYSALDPVVVPGGVAVDLGILRAVPYLVVRVLGRWLVAFNVAGLYMAAGNFNMMVDGGRRRDKFAACGGASCAVGNLLFNQCVDMDCGVVRTWDYEFKGPVKCRDFGSVFTALEPCK
ncbi:MAG: hypothetical protein ABWK05_06060 [Pyrobaculum sp.]